MGRGLARELAAPLREQQPLEAPRLALQGPGLGMAQPQLRRQGQAVPWLAVLRLPAVQQQGPVLAQPERQGWAAPQQGALARQPARLDGLPARRQGQAAQPPRLPGQGETRTGRELAWQWEAPLRALPPQGPELVQPALRGQVWTALQPLALEPEGLVQPWEEGMAAPGLHP